MIQINTQHGVYSPLINQSASSNPLETRVTDWLFRPFSSCCEGCQKWRWNNAKLSTRKPQRTPQFYRLLRPTERESGTYRHCYRAHIANRHSQAAVDYILCKPPSRRSCPPDAFNVCIHAVKLDEHCSVHILGMHQPQVSEAWPPKFLEFPTKDRHIFSDTSPWNILKKLAVQRGTSSAAYKLEQDGHRSGLCLKNLFCQPCYCLQHTSIIDISTHVM